MGASIRTLNQYPTANAVTALCDLQVSTQDISLTTPEDKIHSNVYPSLPGHRSSGLRISPCSECFGARVRILDPNRACVSEYLGATDYRLPPDTRSSSMLLFAALASPDSSRLHGVGVLSHGYEDLAGRLRLPRAIINGHSMEAGWQVVIDGMIKSVVWCKVHLAIASIERLYKALSLSLSLS